MGSAELKGGTAAAQRAHEIGDLESPLLKREKWGTPQSLGHLLPTKIEGVALAPAPCKSARSGPPEVSFPSVNLCREVCAPAWERSPWAAVLHAAVAQPDVVGVVRSDVAVVGFRVAQVRPDAVRARDVFRAEAAHFPAEALQDEAHLPDAQFAGRARYLCAGSQAAMEFADAMPPLAGSRLCDSLDDLQD